MVDEVITKQELIDAQKDAQSLDDFINGGDEQVVVTRLLKEYPTLANAIRQIYEKGGKFYPTLAAANADIANIRTDVYVITGDNGAYYKATAGATSLTKSPYDPLSYVDSSLGAKVTSTIVLNYENLSKNIFDKNAPLLNNHRITTDGLIQRHDNSVSTSLIPVKGLTSITVSGLTASPVAYRATRFLDKDKKKVGVNTPVLLNATSVTATVPENAVYFQITLKDGIDTWDLNLDTIQIESGSVATTYAAYSKGKLLGEGVSEIYVEPTQVLSIVDPVFENLSKNIFNKTSALLLNQRITAQGVLEYHSSSVTTQPIYIKGLTSITVSGLTASPVAYRATRFLDKDKKKVGVNTPVLLNATSVTATVPENAVYFQITLKDGIDTWDLNLDTIQIESGSVATAYVSYSKGSLKALLGSDLAAGSGGGLVSKAFNRSVLFIGDSITQTSRVDLGVFDSLDNPFPNFPTYLHDILDIAEFNNYGYSGATFAEYGQVDWRKASHQITQAITNGVDPDIIVVAMGTNDYDKTLGDYETAMSKATLDDLDRTKTLEAARWSFWTIRKTFPNAVCFYCNPLQRGALDSTAFAPTVDGLSKMSLRYGFTLIDQHHESGIIRDLEIGGLHTYLADELHPNTAGRILQAQYIAGKIISRMMY